MSQFTLTSPAFDNGEQIPAEYGYEERNVNPPLEFGGIPVETEAFALIVDDPDAIEPAGQIWDHWVVWNISGIRTEIPAGWNAQAATEGVNDYGETGYGGPNPPDGEHTYRFLLSALDSRLDLPSGSTADELRSAANGHVIAEALLSGTYAP